MTAQRPTPHDLAMALLRHPHANLMIADHNDQPPTIHIYTHNQNLLRVSGDPLITRYSYHIHNGQIFRPRILAAEDWPEHENPQSCQDEPIRLGCQIQPSHALWIGTAGLPVRARDHKGRYRYCILTNYHVAEGRHEFLCDALHQPTIDYPPIGRPIAGTRPRPGLINATDAAIADTLIDGYHTISDHLLFFHYPPGKPDHPRQDLLVCKIGRTTGLTYGRITATGAAVRIWYPDGDCIFEDQIIIEGDDEPFSAPGDSGSGILTHPDLRPIGLLFAGNDSLTVANPIHAVSEALNLIWPFNPNQEQTQ